MRKKLIKSLSSLDAVAVENRVGPGMPDVNCTKGWIELKWLRKWPVHDDTPARLDHPLMPGQKVWIRKRVKRGGCVWVLLQCRREWLLLDGLTAVDVLGVVPREELIASCTGYWKEGLNAEQLIKVITDEAKL